MSSGTCAKPAQFGLPGALEMGKGALTSQLPRERDLKGAGDLRKPFTIEAELVPSGLWVCEGFRDVGWLG